MTAQHPKKYSAAFMSNAKWRKLFACLNCATVPLSVCRWKLTTEDKAIDGWLPDAAQLGEDYVGDCGALNGPFEYKTIEWILIPAKHGYRPYPNAPLQYTHQDLGEIQAMLKSAGNFELEVTDDGIRIYGYKP